MPAAAPTGGCADPGFDRMRSRFVGDRIREFRSPLGGRSTIFWGLVLVAIERSPSIVMSIEHSVRILKPAGGDNQDICKPLAKRSGNHSRLWTTFVGWPGSVIEESRARVRLPMTAKGMNGVMGTGLK